MILSNEYLYSDGQAGFVMAMHALLCVTCGFLGSWIVDIFGVARCMVFGCSMMAVGRMVLCFTDSHDAFLSCLLFLLPIGEGFTSPTFRVCLVRLTTPETRPFAFALSYATVNAGGALGYNLTDLVKGRVWILFGVPYSGLRVALMVTFLAVLLCLVFSFFVVDQRLDGR